MVDPTRASQAALPASTYIESVIVDRKELAAIDDLKLAPHPREVQIDYTSPTFTIPQKVKFRYRLDGYDHDWHDVATRRQAFYTDLPPGSYIFRVIASNSDGIWNESAAKLDFTILPAYYQTNWFVLSVRRCFWHWCGRSISFGCGNWRGSLTCVWRSASASGPASLAICTTRCCRASMEFCWISETAVAAVGKSGRASDRRSEEKHSRRRCIRLSMPLLRGAAAIQGLRSRSSKRMTLPWPCGRSGKRKSRANAELYRLSSSCRRHAADCIRFFATMATV